MAKQNDFLDTPASQVLAVFATFYAGMPVRTALVFLVAVNIIRKHGYAELNTLCDILGAEKSSVSRDLLHLSVRTRSGKVGLGWLEQFTFRHDMRKHPYKLTPKGKNIIGIVEAITRGYVI